MEAVLVVNAGSSSIKFAAFHPDGAGRAPGLICKGHVAQVGQQIELSVRLANGSPAGHVSEPLPGGHFDHDAAMAWMFAWLDAHRGGLELVAVGHRIVHGGPHYASPVRIAEEVLKDLAALIPLAPLHQPHNLKAVRAVTNRWPGVTQVACFDTAFHATQPPVAQAFALPAEITGAGVRRYGFHGISYEYIASQLPRVLGAAGSRVIAAHLGNGASLCAMVEGRSVASSMGFSALDGLVMGTRCGALDPGAVLYLLQEKGMSTQQVSDLLYRRSGLLGVSGISSDMETLLATTDPRAAQAIDLFVYRIVCEIGSLAAAMGGVDALVFSGGIGEHAAPVRARISQGCAWLGAVLDDAANRAGRALIHGASSRLLMAVVPTDEEHRIAVHTLRTMEQG